MTYNVSSGTLNTTIPYHAEMMDEWWELERYTTLCGIEVIQSYDKRVLE